MEKFQEWSGEGIPQTGTVCEVLWNEALNIYFKTKVFGVNEHGQPIHRFEEGPKKYQYQADTLITNLGNRVFRPILNEDQIALRKRSLTCDRIYGVLTCPMVERQGNHSDMAEALYDAGLRFMESPE